MHLDLFYYTIFHFRREEKYKNPPDESGEFYQEILAFNYRAATIPWEGFYALRERARSLLSVFAF